MQSAEQAKNILEEILNSMSIENNIIYDEISNSLNIESPDHALLIGKKGDNLRALQHIVNVIIRRKNYESDWVLIDVAGYKKEKLQKLEATIEDAYTDVISTGQSKRLPPMNSFERRHIHTFLSEKDDIITESEGQEPNRYVVIKKS